MHRLNTKKNASFRALEGHGQSRLLEELSVLSYVTKKLGMQRKVGMFLSPNAHCSPHDRPVNRERDEVLGQRIATLFGKSAEGEDEGLD